MLKTNQIRAQSEAAYGQWGKQWREQAKIHGERFPQMKPLGDFVNTGIGRAALLIANGYSFEENIETIKKFQENVDIVVCDKTLGHCLENGITPQFCILCDANVSYEKYCEKWKDKLGDTILFSNVCANPKWTDTDNKWKDVYFFVNKDVLHSEREFQSLSRCPNVIAAGTNVSNAMVIFMTQCDNNARRNFFGYDKILLIGFDYSWRKGNYYAFDPEANGKIYYMRHQYSVNLANNLCYTSNNLDFSSKWLAQYCSTFNLPLIQCSKESLFRGMKVGNLDEQMSYRHKPEDAEKVRTMSARRQRLTDELNRLNVGLSNIGKEHQNAVLATV